MCYGGGFGTMPAFAADYFGPKNVDPIYGRMLTAWGSASAFGPLLIAYMHEKAGSYHGALHVIAGVMAILTLLPILVRPPRTRDTGATKSVSEPPRIEVAGIASRVAPANPPRAL
jgi:OFA family oxalate/formate antiporter-like MFS transporter